MKKQEKRLEIVKEEINLLFNENEFVVAHPLLYNLLSSPKHRGIKTLFPFHVSHGNHKGG